MRVYVDQRTRRANAPVEDLYRVVCDIGGENGWYSPKWMWELRGLLDRLVGGPGMGKDSRARDLLEVDDTVGFWRVVHAEEPRRVHLIAEMKVPGIAALEFEVEPTPGGSASILTHTAKFEPRGAFGHVYWWLMVPAHGIVFETMVKNMVKAAERLSSDRSAAG